MKPNLAPDNIQGIQGVPAGEIPSAAPDLYAIPGSGEGAPAGGTRPELQLVTDTPIPGLEAPDVQTDGLELVEDQGEAATDDEVRAAENAMEDEEHGEPGSPAGYLTTVREAGRRAVSRFAAEAGETFSGTFGDNKEEYKGGGGWYLRQLIEKALKKMAAKTHPEGCSCEYHEDH